MRREIKKKGNSFDNANIKFLDRILICISMQVFLKKL